MGTRYRWAKGTNTYLDTVDRTETGTSSADGWGWVRSLTYSSLASALGSVKAYSSYSFNTQTGKYSGAGNSIAVYNNDPLSWSAVSQSDKYPYVIPSSGDFICYSNPRANFGINVSEDDVKWSIRGSNLISQWLDQSKGTWESGGFYKRRAVTIPGGNFIEYVTSENSNQYPNGGTSGGYYYGGRSSDSPDPTNISYSTSIAAGQTLTISITKSTGINAGFPAVSYVYQVKRNGGSWSTISTTSNTSTTYSIPNGTVSLQFRVYAKDDSGFVSTTYVTGPLAELPKYTISVSALPSGGGSVSGGGNFYDGTSATVKATPSDGWEFVDWTENGATVSTSAAYTFTVTASRNLIAVFKQKLTAWIGIDGKARKGVELYVGVDGKARKVTAAYIGVNGKARRFL